MSSRRQVAQPVRHRLELQWAESDFELFVNQITGP